MIRPNTPTSSKDAELFVGIVARIGVDSQAICRAIIDELFQYGYDGEQIKLTDSIQELGSLARNYRRSTHVEKRYDVLIKACDELRKRTGQNSIMAALAVGRIVTERTRLNQEPSISLYRRKVYIFNQLKRTEESEWLRSLYGEHYIQISCHAPRQTRLDMLAERIAASHPEAPRPHVWMAEAQRLIDIDDAEDDLEHGQRVRDVFPLSDVVVDASNADNLKLQLERFFRGLFGDNRVTPTHDEYGMQLAGTAALRSSDLSRQVGAAILSARSEIKALGSNEVAKFGGGTYWEGDSPDGRDFSLGRDSNDRRKKEVVLDLAMRFAEAGLLKREYSNATNLERALFERADKKISDAQVMDSLEYGRSIHAEMNAITDAARQGHAVRDCNLFTTTFPCHNCAKHIVAAGLGRVVYLKPYPKSYARELFKDSLIIDADQHRGGRVQFEQFIGICGSMYERIFGKSRWKTSSGTVPSFDKRTADFLKRTRNPTYLSSEILSTKQLGEWLTSGGYRPSKKKTAVRRPKRRRTS